MRSLGDCFASETSEPRKVRALVLGFVEDFSCESLASSEPFAFQNKKSPILATQTNKVCLEENLTKKTLLDETF